MILISNFCKKNYTPFFLLIEIFHNINSHKHIELHKKVSDISNLAKSICIHLIAKKAILQDNNDTIINKQNFSIFQTFKFILMRLNFKYHFYRCFLYLINNTDI